MSKVPGTSLADCSKAFKLLGAAMRKSSKLISLGRLTTIGEDKVLYVNVNIDKKRIAGMAIKNSKVYRDHAKVYDFHNSGNRLQRLAFLVIKRQTYF